MVSFQLFNEKSKYTLFEFEFLQTLGCGSFANVKLVREKKTGKFFALKMVRINNSKTANAEIYNIKCEIFIHRKLDHPNIIKFHDYIQHDASVYLLLDYTENGNLYTYLHRKKYLTEKEIFKFFYQTCLAVQYLHENDVLHRDIKPENLLLDHDLNVKLCDFGWATQRIQDKRLTFCGTYEYMAPEIAYKRPYDYHVDIWSLGILLYELIHSEPPFKGRSLPEIYKSFTRGIVKFSSSCHPEAKDLIQKILKQNPNDRLSLAQILSHPWVTYNLCKEEILDLSPCLPPQKILLHSHSLPPETTDTGISARHSRDCEPKTATNAHHKVLQYDTWSEYFKGKPGEIQSSKSLLDTTDKTTDYQKNNNTAPELRDQETKIGLYNNGSYRELNNIQVNPVENVQVVAEQPERARTPSPNSAAHMKSGSAPNVVKTPKKSNEDNNKVFAGNIFSPSFKSKLTTAIRQLTVQTPASQGNKAVNSVNTSKNVLQQINQNTPVAQNTHVSGPFSKAFSLPEEKENHYKKLSDTTNTTKEETKLFSNDHFESCFQTTYQVRPETKGPSVLDFMKPNFLEHTYYKAGDDVPPVPCSSATTRTNTSDFEIKHPFEKPSKEATEQTHYELNVKKEHAKVLPEGFGHSKQPSGHNIGEYLQPNSKKALQLKGILGANVVRYHIPIPLTNNRQIRNKENFLNCVGK